MRRLVHRFLAATLLGVAAGPAALSAPAHAAACSGGQGVTVVVNTSVGCDADGGGRAAQNFADAGHQLKYASRAPGFVCRVDGAPASDPCVDAAPTDAYWALFWSDGTSGSWVYSSLGVTALKVPQGGAVAFVFQSSSSRTWPSVKAPVAAPAPEAPQATAPPRESGSGSGTGSGSAGRGSTAQPRTPADGRGTGRSAAPVPGAPLPSGSAIASVPTASASASTGPTTAPTSGATSGTEVSAGEAPEIVTPLASGEDEGTSAAARVVGVGVIALLAVAAAIVARRRLRG